MYMKIPTSLWGGHGLSRVPQARTHKVSLTPCQAAGHTSAAAGGGDLPNKSLQMWGFLCHESAGAQPEDSHQHGAVGGCSRGGDTPQR